jgi:hypothetical protein
MLWGGAIAVAAVVAGTAAALATGATLEVAGVSTAAWYGAAESFAIGYGYEVWLRGIPLRFARRAGVSDRWAFVFVTCAGVAVVALEPKTTIAGLLLAAASSAAFAAMWLRGGDGYGPIAAHVSWVWLADALLEGDALRLVERGGELTARASAFGAPAVAAASVFILGAIAVSTGKIHLPTSVAVDFALALPEPVKKKRTRKKAARKQETRS